MPKSGAIFVHDLFKAVDETEGSHKSDFFRHACATFHELPSDISTMVQPVNNLIRGQQPMPGA